MPRIQIGSVKKLKSLAARRAREQGLTHSEALEAVSRDAGFPDYFTARRSLPQTGRPRQPVEAMSGASGGAKQAASYRPEALQEIVAAVRRASLTKAGKPRKDFPGKQMSMLRFGLVRDLCEAPGVRPAALGSSSLRGLVYRYESARDGTATVLGGSKESHNPERLSVLVAWSQVIEALEASGVDWRTPADVASATPVRQRGGEAAPEKRARRSTSLQETLSRAVAMLVAGELPDGAGGHRRLAPDHDGTYTLPVMGLPRLSASRFSELETFVQEVNPLVTLSRWQVLDESTSKLKVCRDRALLHYTPREQDVYVVKGASRRGSILTHRLVREGDPDEWQTEHVTVPGLGLLTLGKDFFYEREEAAKHLRRVAARLGRRSQAARKATRE